MAFSLMLRQLRKERHLSQKEIADYLGMTRQAIASYELGKREPGYEILKKLADYFSVSIDYLLGRAGSRDVNALTVGGNIELIRGNLTYKEMSEDIDRKTGTLIFHEMLELYAKGERMPFIGIIKILARYAFVRESFFYTHNTPESYEREKELFRKEIEQDNFNDNSVYNPTILGFIDNELGQWVLKEGNLQYVKLAKEIHEAGLSADALKPLIDEIKIRKKGNGFKKEVDIIP